MSPPQSTPPPNEQKQQTIQNHYQSLKRLLNQDHNILISGEGISTMSKQPLIRLKSKLEQHGFTVEPFALVRPPLRVHHICTATNNQKWKAPFPDQPKTKPKKRFSKYFKDPQLL